MNYWERWIGDWKRKTAILSLAEKGAYGELLDLQYANDLHVLPLDHKALYRVTGASSKDEFAAVDAVMKAFYTQTTDGYVNKRASEEIKKRAEFVSKQTALANRRWSKPDAHGEVKQKPEAHAAPMVFPAWLDVDQFNRWLKIRPAKARTPDAQKAAIGKLEKLRAAGHDGNAIVSESLANGWQGLFKPDPKQSQQSPVNHSPSLQRKPCAYCNAPSIGRVNQIDHCRAHSDAATFHEPLPRGKNDAIPTNT